MLDTPFDPHQPYSYFTLGNSSANFLRVVLLHGVGSSAEEFRSVALDIQKLFPQAAITVINGKEQISVKDGEGHALGFSWYGESNENKSHSVIAKIIRGFSVDPKHVVVFGFSQGGFVAADVVHNHPDVARHAILHSSALIGAYKNATSPAKPSCTYDTILSIDDPFLRTPMVLGIFRHYWASYKFRKSGDKTCTRFSNGFGHNITEKSLTLVAKTIEKRLTL